MDWQHMGEVAGATMTAFGLKVLGAIVAWIVGRYLIHLALRLIGAGLTRQEVDATLQRYIGNIVNVALNIVLVVAILGYFGVETTSFAALIAGMGVAIGAAWAGLLANFAAGAFLVVLRPFKVGDYVKAGGLEGTVKEIGLFATTILTPDNVSSFVGNNKIFSDYHPEFLSEPVSTRRAHRSARAHGRRARCDPAAEGGARGDSERAGGSQARRRNRRLQHAWPGARRAPLYAYQ